MRAGLAVLGLAGMCALAAACAQVEEREADDGTATITAMAAEAKTSMHDAIGTALLRQPGTAVEAELDRDDGTLVYEITILSTDVQVYDAIVATDSGEVIELELEDESDEADEIRATGARLPAGSLSLAEMLRIAEAHTGGKAIEAEIESDEDGTECEVLVAVGGKLVEVEVDPRDGRILEVEDADDDDDDDDADDDDDDDDDDDEDDDEEDDD